MNDLRSEESLKELNSSALQTHHNIESSLLALQGRWFALREHYLGLGAEDVESELNSVFAQTQRLLESLMQWQNHCQTALESKQKDD